MTVTRDDLVPHYREDLAPKVERVRKVIMDLPSYNIPEISDITKEEYELIRLSVINSIKGEQIAFEEKSRQDFVERVYLTPAKEKGILEYKDQSATTKCDFIGSFLATGGKPPHHFGLEVKGGEGNSVTLIQRPIDANTFIVWSHLDVMSNTPSQNMRAVLGRIVKQMVNRDEKRQKVDFLVFYDEWYENGVKVFKHGEPLPDVFVFPELIPTKSNPHPKLPDPIRGDHPFLSSLMTIVGSRSLDEETKKHIWYCDIHLEREGTRWMRKMKVFNAYDAKITLTTQEYTRTSCVPEA